jgi:hypothetical protein
MSQILTSTGTSRQCFSPPPGISPLWDSSGHECKRVFSLLRIAWWFRWVLIPMQLIDLLMWLVLSGWSCVAKRQHLTGVARQSFHEVVFELTLKDDAANLCSLNLSRINNSKTTIGLLTSFDDTFRYDWRGISGQDTCTCDGKAAP